MSAPSVRQRQHRKETERKRERKRRRKGREKRTAMSVMNAHNTQMLAPVWQPSTHDEPLSQILQMKQLNTSPPRFKKLMQDKATHSCIAGEPKLCCRQHIQSESSTSHLPGSSLIGMLPSQILTYFHSGVNQTTTLDPNMQCLV